MKKSTTIFLAMTTLLAQSLFFVFPGPKAFADSFSDVNQGHKNFMAISYLKEQNIIQGYQDGSFKPNNNITRAEAIKMIMSNVNPENQTIKAPFKDVSAEEWYTPYIAEAKEKNLIAGYADGTFRPNQDITLAEMLKIYFENSPDFKSNTPSPNDDPFKDVNKNNWLAPYAQYAKNLNLIYINLDNTIDPEQKLSRGYLAEIIYRTELSKKGYYFGKATFYGAVAHGKGTASGETFNMNSFSTAHQSLPFGTKLEVKNLANAQSVEVKVNDRGPNGPGRVLDLSSSAFKELAPLSRGVINVQYKILE